MARSQAFSRIFPNGFDEILTRKLPAPIPWILRHDKGQEACQEFSVSYECYYRLPPNRMNEPLILVPLAVLFFACADIGWDTLVRCRFRPGHAQGAVGRAAGFAGIGWWVLCHRQVDAQFGVILLLCSILVLLGACVLIDRTDIADQESGSMSKWGDWWDKYENNYLSNKLDIGFNYLALQLVAGALLITVFGSHVVTEMVDHRPTSLTVTSSAVPTQPKAVKSSTVRAHNHHGSAKIRAKNNQIASAKKS